MRTLSLGSLALGFAVILVSWDVSRRYLHVPPGTAAPSFTVGGGGTAPAADQAAMIAPRDVEVPKGAGTAISTAVPVELAATESRVSRGGPAAVEDRPRRPGYASSLAIRQHTPGSKAHIGAVASALASNEHRNAVEPLARLYFAFFDRFADYEGLDYYLDERDGGASLESIAEEFAGSSEFSQRYGTLDNAAFIDRMFRVVFDGPPDSTQRAYWIGQLESGTTRGQVMVAFSESPAFRAATSNEVFVTMAYAEALRREPDPAGFARWVRFLDAGNPREAVIAGLLGGGRTKG